MNKDQAKTPLFDGLLNHVNQKPVQFHIPGHKGGAGMDSQFREFIGGNALSLDLINIEPLDDLHHPGGIIQEAQSLAAEAFGAEHTFFFCPRDKRCHHDHDHECRWPWGKNYCAAKRS